LPSNYQNLLTFVEIWRSSDKQKCTVFIETQCSSASDIFAKFRRSHPLRGAKYRWGIKISRFSIPKSGYISQTIGYKIAP